MNVLQLTKSLHKGGVESHIHDLSVALNSKGHKSIVGSDNCIQKEEHIKSGIGVSEIKFITKNPFTFVKNIGTINKIIKEHSIDVVHCHWRICCLYMKFYNLFHRKKTPYVWTCHLAGMRNSFWVRKLSFFDKYIIGVSSDCSNMVIEKFGINKQYVKTVYNGINILEEEKRVKKDRGQVFDITMLSRLEPIKNHSCMLRALSRLIKEYGMTDVNLKITGNGNEEYKEKLVSLSKELEIDKYVDFCGFVNAYDILGKTDVMVLPSNMEGFPISVLEAFNMKVPVVRTRTGGYNDVKDYCWDFDFDSDEQLAKILADMYHKKIDIQQKVEAAHKFLCKECSVEAMTNSIIEVYNKAIKEK